MAERRRWQPSLVAAVQDVVMQTVERANSVGV
jgi:hypothetical protein